METKSATSKRHMLTTMSGTYNYRDQKSGVTLYYQKFSFPLAEVGELIILVGFF